MRSWRPPEGTATIQLEQDGAGATIRLRSDLAPRHRLLRMVNQLAPPVSRRLHDRVVDRAFEQFVRRGDPGAGDQAR
jgi:hypothetical protein